MWCPVVPASDCSGLLWCPVVPAPDWAYLLLFPVVPAAGCLWQPALPVAHNLDSLWQHDVSAHAPWLCFLRNARGRGGLWDRLLHHLPNLNTVKGKKQRYNGHSNWILTDICCTDVKKINILLTTRKEYIKTAFVKYLFSNKISPRAYEKHLSLRFILSKELLSNVV